MMSTSSRNLLALCLVTLASTAVVDASGCHGVSRFRLAPTYPRKAQSSLGEKSQWCREEYGDDATLMDLEQMEGEFENPTDLQHALNPLFDNDDAAIKSKLTFFVADHGKDFVPRNYKITPFSHHEEQGKFDYVLRKVAAEELSNVEVSKIVVGQVVLENINDHDFVTGLSPLPQVLCYIPKPKYDPETAMSMKGMEMGNSKEKMNPMESSGNYRDTASESTMMYQEVNETSSSQLVLVFFLGMAAVGAVGLTAFQKYKTHTQQGSHFSNSMMSPSLNLGGSYSILSDSDMHQQELTQTLSPTSLELA